MQTVRCFKSDVRGTTAALFGLTVLPVMVLVGAAVDYSRASAAHARMQSALDAAALALSRGGGHLADSELQARAQSVFTSVFGTDPSVTAAPLAVTREGKSIRVEATGTVRTAFMQIAGFNEMAIGGTAVAARKKIELALVLDNTGSMASKNKLEELKRASKDLVDKLEIAARQAGDRELVKISIVPFNSKVNVGVGHKDAWWITYKDHANPALRMSKKDWQGCVTDREEMQDLDTRDDRRIAGDPSTLHLATVCGEYFGQRLERQELAQIRALTNDFDSLRDTIKSMKADGCTNITIGAAWGLDTLSDNSPFTGAAAYGTPDVDKFMILLTDGKNTRSRDYRNSDCSEGDHISARIDPRTRKACDNIKAAGGARPIRLYTIRVVDGSAALLSDCASKDEKGNPLYYDVGDAAGLQGVFQEIVNEILATRLSH